MKVLYIRTNDYQFDSRVIKELKSLKTLSSLDITCVGWNRNGNNTKKVEKTEINIEGITFKTFLIDIFGPWGRGPKKNFFPLLLFMKTLKRWLKRNIKEFDVIHCVDLATGYYAIPLAKKYKLKVVYDLFDYFPDIRKYPKIIRNFFVACENKCINNADVTIICSEERIKQIGEAKPKKLVVVHNSPDIDPFNYNYERDNERIVFSYIGNLVNDRLIDLILHYFSVNQEYILNIGGVGALSEMAENYSKEFTNIHFLGPLKYSDVLDAENKSDIIIALYKPDVPNHKYVASNKFYEALALGKEIMMCAGTGMDDEILKYNLGVLIDPNYESFDLGVKKLVGNKAGWEANGTNKKRIFESKYSWIIMSRRILDIYKSFK